MKIIGWFLFLWSAFVWAEDFAALETHVQNQANHYIAEIRQIKTAQEPIATHLKKVSTVLVFLSFSMPQQSLKAWLLQCKQSGATPVIRGLIHNSFKETIAAIKTLSETTGIGMQIDPILFRTFEIDKVPAVVYVKDIPDCSANMDCKAVEYDTLYGDVSLDYALEKINQGQSKEDAQLQNMLLQLRGGL